MDLRSIIGTLRVRLPSHLVVDDQLLITSWNGIIEEPFDSLPFLTTGNISRPLLKILSLLLSVFFLVASVAFGADHPCDTTV